MDFYIANFMMKTNIVLSSFYYYLKNSNLFFCDYVYSVARWQPTFLKEKFPTINFLTATTISGQKLLLRNFENPILDYKREYFKKISKYKNQFFNWLDTLQYQNIVLLCWCPHASSPKNQLEKYNNFICHIGLIGRLINKYKPEYNIILDEEHLKLNKYYLPYKFRVLSKELSNANKRNT